MKNINNIFRALVLAAAAFSLVSCENWLDVTASNEIRKDDHYSTELGFQQTLIGCYIEMAESELYGRTLTWNEIERMAGQYRRMQANYSSLPALYSLERHDYTYSYSESSIESIWSKGYNVIANANDALSIIDDKKDIMSDIGYHIVKGELLAVRAYMHFDLLRLFGYGNWSTRASELNSKLTLPYVTELSPDTPPQATGAEFIQDVINDLQEAAELMHDYDPVVGVLPDSDYDEINHDGFYDYREGHLNYYAVEALLARVCMWTGSDEHRAIALEAAKTVIDRLDNPPANAISTTKFDLRLLSEISMSTRSFYPEDIFALQVNDMSDLQDGLLMDQVGSNDVAGICIDETTVQEVFESSLTDIRCGTIAMTMEIDDRIPMKLRYNESFANYGFRVIDRVPMIRIPEIYYIAAECSTLNGDLSAAAGYLNVIRQSRGISAIDVSAVSTQDAMMTEIANEYRREFISEGVMFYYYKRTGATSMPGEDDCGDDIYVLPYPNYEIAQGRIQ